MKNTWMLYNNDSRNKYILELISLIKFFETYINHHKYIKWVYNLISFFTIISKNFFIKNSHFVSNSVHLINNEKNYFLKDNITYTHQHFNTRLLDQKIARKNIRYPQSNKFNIRLEDIFLYLNYSTYPGQFTHHGSFRNMFVVYSGHRMIVCNINRVLKRWYDFLNLSFNLSFYQINTVFLGSDVFKKEISALNWNTNLFDFEFWRFSNTFFIYKMNKFTNKLDFILDKVRTRGADCMCVSDSIFHYRTLHYIKRQKIASIALIPVNINPWIVEYPVFSFFDGFSSQLFFIKLNIFCQRRAKYETYSLFRRYWIFLLFHRLNININF